MRGHLSETTIYGALTTAAGETTVVDDIYVLAGTVGLVIDVFHTSAGSGTVTYKIQGYHYNDGLAAWTQSYTTLLTSAAIAKDTGTRLVVDPRVTAVANTHACTVLPYKIKINATAATADATGVYVSVTQAG